MMDVLEIYMHSFPWGLENDVRAYIIHLTHNSFPTLWEPRFTLPSGTAVFYDCSATGTNFYTNKTPRRV